MILYVVSASVRHAIRYRTQFVFFIFCNLLSTVGITTNICPVLFRSVNDDVDDEKFEFGVRDGHRVRGCFRTRSPGGRRPRQRTGSDATDGMASVAEVQVHYGLRFVSRRVHQV